MAAVMPHGNVRGSEEKPLHPFFARSQGSRRSPSDALLESSNSLLQTYDQLQEDTESGYSTDKDRDDLSNRSASGADSGLPDVNDKSSIDRCDGAVSPPLIKLVLSPFKSRSHEQNSSSRNAISEGKRTIEEPKELLSWEEDPNVRQRKRQKTESPAPATAITTTRSDAHAVRTQNEAEISAEWGLWLRQLEEAALSQPEENMKPIPDETNPMGTPPRRQRSLSPYITAFRPTANSSGMSSSPFNKSPIAQHEDSPHVGAVDLTQPPSTVNDARWQDSTGDATTTEKTPRVKIMKLRRNGKLSSSPTQMPLENRNSKQAKAKGTSRGSKRLSDKMTVILSYGIDHESKKLIGSKIDAITNDSQSYHPDDSLASAPFLTSKGPPKATHPFFLSKAARKREVALDIASDQVPSVSKDVISCNRNCSISPRKGLTFQTRPASTTLPPLDPTTTISHVGKSKFPTPKIPIWPPKELHHIRGNQTTIEGITDLSSTRLISNRTSKAKESILQISENENILSQIAQRLLVKSQISRDQVHQTLRLPHRKLMTGHDLQKFPGKQLSCDLTDPTTGIDTPLKHAAGQEKTTGRKKHSALVNLYSSIETSSTAFDNGQCDTVPWTQKYAPRRVEHVLMCGPEAATLRDWISNLVVLAVGKGVSSTKSTVGKGDNLKRKKKRQRRSDDNLDDFVILSEEEADEMTEIPGSEDELSRDDDHYRKKSMIKAGDSLKVPRGSQNKSQLTNAILISGPSGCGKTALVHAIAGELGFEIFEINPGLRRSGKDIFEKVGDMTQNHLVRHHKEINSDTPDAGAAQVSDNTDRDIQLGQQGVINSFFKTGSKTAGKCESTKKPKKSPVEEKPSPSQNQKQSLILLEEVDILFEEDKAFWPSVLDLIRQSKRPVIMTCNDESLVPMDDLDLHAILRCNPPPHDLAVDYLLLLAANEGHILDRETLSCLYRGKNSDLRASINEVDFWCQMAIGDRKGGLEWMMDRWPPGVDLDSEGRKLRVTSTDTLLTGMGWFSRDGVIDGSDAPVIKHMELMSEGWDFWGMHLLDIPDIHDVHPASGILQVSLNSLRQYERYSESLSAIDGLCVGDGSPQDPKIDQLDATQPEMSPKALLSIREGYTFLQADITDHPALRYQLASAIRALSNPSWISKSTFEEHNLVEVIMKKQATVPQEALVRASLFTAFDAIIEPPQKFPDSASVRQSSSFDGPPATIVEDLAPYVRCIVASDVRLERQRHELSKQLLRGGLSGRTRTTRASRAALEGGNKATTRKERHFPKKTNFSQVLSTGQTTWLEALGSLIERESDIGGELSRSSSELLLGGSPESVVIHD